MSANTTFFVEIERVVTEVIQVSAVTEEDAREEARKVAPECVRVSRVWHWSEREQQEG